MNRPLPNFSARRASQPSRLRRRAFLSLAALLAACSLGAAKAGASTLELWERSAAAHPDDPALQWGLAQSLADEKQLERAVEVLGEYLQRWPERRPDAQLTMGRWLYELEQDEEARGALEEAVEIEPRSSAAHLHLGLVLRRIGELRPAELQFRFAARFDRTLRPEAMLLAGLTRMQLGENENAELLLREVIELDPDGEPAQYARLVLGDAAQRRPRAGAEFYIGTEYDSNVTLENEVNGGNANGDAAARSVWGANGWLDAYRDPSNAVRLGLRYDASAHLGELGEFDTQRGLFVLTGHHQFSQRFAARLDGWVAYSSLDYDPYLLQALIRLNGVASLGGRWGFLRLFAEVEQLAYQDSPIFSSLERDGYLIGTGLEYSVPLPVPYAKKTWLQWLGSYHRLETDAETDLLGFKGEYDHNRYRSSLSLRSELPWQVRLESGVALNVERYANKSLLDLLTGDASPDRRNDFFVETWATLARPITDYLDAELSWRFSKRNSNVELFRYDRHVVGLNFRAYPVKFFSKGDSE